MIKVVTWPYVSWIKICPIVSEKLRHVTHAEIKDNDWDLNITRYLQTATVEGITVEVALAELAKAQAALRKAEMRLAERLRAARYE